MIQDKRRQQASQFQPHQRSNIVKLSKLITKEIQIKRMNVLEM
jgi:hypothetical protein